MSETDLKVVANKVINSPDGKILFEHLFKKYYDCKFKPENLEMQVGARSVLHYIRLLSEK